MSRYCGVCGTSLGVVSLSTGRCERCNARIEASDLPASSVGERDAALSDASTQAGRIDAVVGDPAHTNSSERGLYGQAPDIFPLEGRAPPAAVQAYRQRRETPRVPLLWVLSLLLVVALLLVSGALILLARNGNIPIVVSPFTSSNANSSSNSSSNISGATGTATSSGVTLGQGGPGQTPGTGPGTSTTPSATQTANGTPTVGAPPSTATVGEAPTSTPTPAFLSVSPTGFPELVCPTSVQFTISNTGQAPLMWSASTGSGYTVSPSSDTVNGGDNESVTVNVTIHLLTTVKVTITASGAENSPQQVTISCTL